MYSCLSSKVGCADALSGTQRRRQEVTQEVLQWGIPSTLLDTLAASRPTAAQQAASSSASTLLPISTSSSTSASILDPRLNSTLESLVSGYLNHHGFAETSRAFRRQREAEKDNWADLLVPGRAAGLGSRPIVPLQGEEEDEGDDSQAGAAGSKAKGKSSGKKSGKEGKGKSSYSTGSKLKKEKSDTHTFKTMGSAVRTTLDSGERSDVDLVHSQERATQTSPADDKNAPALPDDLMMSDVPSGKTSDSDVEEQELQDTARRQSICQSILDGAIDAATADLEEYYPSVLHPSNNTGSLSGTMALPALDPSETSARNPQLPMQGRKAEEGMDILFRLRCRKFVELVLASTNDRLEGEGEEDVDMQPESSGSDEEDEQVASALIPSRHNSPIRPSASKGKGKARQQQDSDDSAAAVEDVLMYGARLNALYPRSLSSPETRNYLNTIFSLVAFNDPASQPGEIGRLCQQERRLELADAVNKAMLGEFRCLL